jgi:serine/threonine-protein kinase
MSEAETVSVPRAVRLETPAPVHLPSLVAPDGPRSLGPYELLAVLGEGGMGSVCIARRSGPGGFHRHVALKRIHAHLAGERETVAMFLDEARLAATVSHRNVTQIYELGENGGAHFLVMELVDGAPLSALLRLGPIPLHIALYALAEAAHGLHAAHEARDHTGRPLHLVHRDVSPSNVLVGFDGAVKVTDFGVAKAEGRLARTETGHVRGKTSYMAPEQALGHDVDRRADVFALGVLLHELATGQRPFGKGSSAEILLRVVSHERPALRAIAPGLSASVVEIVERCLAPERAERFPTAGAVADALDELRAREAPCSAADVARWMESLLGADRRARRAQLAALELSFDTPPAMASAVVPALPATSQAPGPKTRRVWFAALVVAIGVLAVLAVVALPAAPAPTELATIEPAPTEPAPTEPAPPEPAPPEPAPTEPATAEPTTAERAPIGGAATARAATEPRVVESAAEPVQSALPRAERGNGTLSARCAQPAEVWLDGALLGETFLSIDVPAGRHRLVLRRDGIEDRRTITIRRGAATSVGDCFAAR